MKVAFFVTCLADAYLPRAAVAAVKVLEHFGCRIDFPAAQTCCGQPMWNNGYRAETRDLARRMIEIFERAEHVVTPSASCAAIVRNAYPELFEDESRWQERARDLAARTYEFVEFLVKVLKVDPAEVGARWPGPVTYHYSCHHREIGLEDETSRFLEAVEGLDYRPIEDLEVCCGFGGTFATRFPRVSGAMARDKVDAIRATGAATVVSNETGCTMNLAGCCHRHGIEARFVSLAELLAEGLGLEVDP